MNHEHRCPESLNLNRLSLCRSYHEQAKWRARNDRDRQAYAMIKNRSFVHTRAFDPKLLEKTGMDVDFARVWHAVGWDDFVPVEENGSRLLTIQFLFTLRKVDDSVYFQPFGVERYFNWRNFSHLLGFSARLPVSLIKACRVLIDMSSGVVHGKFVPRCYIISLKTSQVPSRLY